MEPNVLALSLPSGAQQMSQYLCELWNLPILQLLRLAIIYVCAQSRLAVFVLFSYTLSPNSPPNTPTQVYLPQIWHPSPTFTGQ